MLKFIVQTESFVYVLHWCANLQLSAPVEVFELGKLASKYNQSPLPPFFPSAMIF